MRLRVIIGACALMFVTGCETASDQGTTAQGQAAPAVTSTQLTAPQPTAPPPPGSPVPAAQIVRYIGTNSDKWSATKSPQSYADLYTRFELYGPGHNGVAPGDQSHPNLRDYESENRGWLARLVESETDTITTLANIEIRDPELKLSIPLFSVSHASGRDLGNTWSTNFTASNVESPLFRIGPNTALTIHLSAKASRDLKSQGVAIAVQAVTTAVQIAAPSSSLLTTLSKSNIDNKAHAIDQAISNLLSQDITEDIEFGRLADSWTPTSELTLFGCAPFVRTEAPGPGSPAQCGANDDIDGGKNIFVGTWSLQLACPRPSVFDTRDICQDIGATKVDATLGATKVDTTSDGTKVDTTRGMIDLTKLPDVQKTISDTVSDAQILAFNLSPNVTIQSFAQAQSWYSTFISTFPPTVAITTTNAAAAAAAYTNFCTNALLALETNGLNKFDSLQTMRAMIRQLPQLVALKANFAATSSAPGSTCVTLLTDAGLKAPFP